MKKIWHDEAWEHYLEWTIKDKQVHKKINKLVQDIDRNYYEGIGKPEPLKHDLSGWWSRRIDEKHRLVYRIKNDNIEILQCKGHYKDK